MSVKDRLRKLLHDLGDKPQVYLTRNLPAQPAANIVSRWFRGESQPTPEQWLQLRELSESTLSPLTRAEVETLYFDFELHRTPRYASTD